jgi:hypothetical protein
MHIEWAQRRHKVQTCNPSAHCCFLVPQAISQHGIHFKNNISHYQTYLRRILTNERLNACRQHYCFVFGKPSDQIFAQTGYSDRYFVVFILPSKLRVYNIWGLWFHGREYDDQCLLGCDVVLTGKMRPFYICNAALIQFQNHEIKMRNSTKNLYTNNCIQKYVVLFTLQYNLNTEI